MKQTELILNPDGSVYHLNLLPGDVAELILLVGDPGRVSMVSKYFDEHLVKKQKREFITETGRIGNIYLTVISTGIGTDNIDIVVNELDALFNIDLGTRFVKEKLTNLQLIRIGTSGALQPDIALDTFVVSKYGLGLDAFARLRRSFHDEVSREWFEALLLEAKKREIQLEPAYMATSENDLLELFDGKASAWITVTCAGFYELQGRSIRLIGETGSLFEFLREFQWNGLKAGNLEMETAGLYLLSRMLGHKAIALNAIIANRATGHFSKDPYGTVDAMIRMTLEQLSVT